MDHGGMSVRAHVKVTPSTIPQLSNRPIMMALLDQCVNYYYSNGPAALTACKMAATATVAQDARLLYLLREAALEWNRGGSGSKNAHGLDFFFFFPVTCLQPRLII